MDMIPLKRPHHTYVGYRYISRLCDNPGIRIAFAYQYSDEPCRVSLMGVLEMLIQSKGLVDATFFFQPVKYLNRYRCEVFLVYVCIKVSYLDYF